MDVTTGYTGEKQQGQSQKGVVKKVSFSDLRFKIEPQEGNNVAKKRRLHEELQPDELQADELNEEELYKAGAIYGSKTDEDLECCFLGGTGRLLEHKKGFAIKLDTASRALYINIHLDAQAKTYDPLKKHVVDDIVAVLEKCQDDELLQEGWDIIIAGDTNISLDRKAQDESGNDTVDYEATRFIADVICKLNAIGIHFEDFTLPEGPVDFKRTSEPTENQQQHKDEAVSKWCEIVMHFKKRNLSGVITLGKKIINMQADYGNKITAASKKNRAFNATGAGKGTPFDHPIVKMNFGNTTVVAVNLFDTYSKDNPDCQWQAGRPPQIYHSHYNEKIVPLIKETIIKLEGALRKLAEEYKEKATFGDQFFINAVKEAIEKQLATVWSDERYKCLEEYLTEQSKQSQKSKIQAGFEKLFCEKIPKNFMKNLIDESAYKGKNFPQGCSSTKIQTSLYAMFSQQYIGGAESTEQPYISTENKRRIVGLAKAKEILGEILKTLKSEGGETSKIHLLITEFYVGGSRFSQDLIDALVKIQKVILIADPVKRIENIELIIADIEIIQQLLRSADLQNDDNLPVGFCPEDWSKFTAGKLKRQADEITSHKLECDQKTKEINKLNTHIDMAKLCLFSVLVSFGNPYLLAVATAGAFVEVRGRLWTSGENKSDLTLVDPNKKNA